MPILTETNPGSFNRYYGDFLAAHPTDDRRYGGAVRVAEASVPGAQEGLPEIEYVSRNYLLAHWGDDDPALRQAAEFVYTLAAAVEDGLGQPAMVFTKGTADDVMTASYLDKEIAFNYGVVYQANLRHAFAANLAQRGPRREGVRPPYLAYRVMIDIYRVRTVTADLGLATCEITPVADNPPLVARLGRMSLDRTAGVYDASRNVEERSVVVGKEMCALVLEHLGARTYESGSATRFALKQLAQ